MMSKVSRETTALVGKIEDEIAYELLPAKTRALVGPGAKIFWDGTPMVSKLGWIVDRTKVRSYASWFGEYCAISDGPTFSERFGDG